MHRVDVLLCFRRAEILTELSKRFGAAEASDALNAVNAALGGGLPESFAKRAQVVKQELSQPVVQQQQAHGPEVDKKREKEERKRMIKQMQADNRAALSQGNGHRIETQMGIASQWLAASDKTMRDCGEFLQGGV